VKDSACAGADVSRLGVLLGVVVAVMIAACGRDRGDRGDQADQTPGGGQAAGARQPCTPPGNSYRGDRGAFVAWAQGLGYQADSSRAYVYGFAGADSIQIASAVLDTAGPGGVSPHGCVYARITSARDMPARGIAAGVSYLMADSIGGANRTVMIPEDAGDPVTTHALVLHSHVPDSTPPTVGAFGACGQCKKMWCRSTFDSPSTLQE
jgi:hypothetical protein